MNFRDQPPPSIDGPPRALRALGLVAMATVLGSTLFTDPKPSFHGDGPLVILAIALLAGGLVLALPARRVVRRRARFIGLALVGVATLIFAAVQPDSAGYAGVYFVMALGGIRLSRDARDRRSAAARSAGSCDPADRAREPRRDRRPAVQRAPVVLDHAADPPARDPQPASWRSRAPRTPQAAALGERGRVARELHDVLAHSLSALALQLEGTRLLARDRDADPEVDRGAGARAPPRGRAG